MLEHLLSLSFLQNAKVLLGFIQWMLLMQRSLHQPYSAVSSVVKKLW